MIVYEYEILFLEDNLYYIRYYPLGREYKCTDLKLTKEEYEKFRKGNVEI